MPPRLPSAWVGLKTRRLLGPVLLVLIGGLFLFSLLGFERWNIGVWLLACLLVLVPRLQALHLLAADKTEQWVDADNKGRQTLAQVFGGFILLAGAYAAWGQFRNQQDQIAEQRRQFQIQTENQQHLAEEQRRQFTLQIESQQAQGEAQRKQVQLQIQNQQRQLEEQRKQFQLQFEATREEQAGERFTRAVEQLVSEALDVRLGAIYALERVSRDSPDRQWTVLEVLTAYIRKRAPWRAEPPGPPPLAYVPPPRPAPDIQAALTVLARNPWPNLDLLPRPRPGMDPPLPYFAFRANLAATDLRGADLIEAINFLKRADLTASHLEGADLRGAQMEDAILNAASFDRARLDGATLRRAYLNHASLFGAALENADLSGARMEGAVLRCAYLLGTNLGGAVLSRATMERAWTTPKTNFVGAQLGAVIFCDQRGLGYSQQELPASARRASPFSRAPSVAGNVKGAKFFAADLRGCSVDFEGWREAEYYLANVHGVIKAPTGFVEWATTHGAVSIADYSQWRRMWGSGSHQLLSEEGCPDMPPEWYMDVPR